MRQVYIISVKFKPTAKRDDAVLFLTDDSHTRAEWIKAVKDFDEDLDLRRTQWVGSIQADIGKIQPLSFEVDVTVNV